jgi:asparagine synthase (glutamine-hydrolysing)
MPGLCGVVSRQLPLAQAERRLERMQDLLRHRDEQAIAAPTLFSPDPGSVGSLAVSAIWRKPGHGFAVELREGVTLYCDGELYGESAPLTWQETARFFSELDLLKGDSTKLAAQDGVFSAAIADTQRGILHLITDPFGLRPLYVRETAGALWFSGELKGMLALGSLEIDHKAAHDFLRIGHFLGEATWFQGVRLMAPASHLRYDLATGRIVTSRYRPWPPDSKNRTEGGALSGYHTAQPTANQEVVSALSTLFEQAVKRRVGEGEKVGQLLSGGLDSRAIFAALPKSAEPIPVLTFGRPNCRDINLALKVSALRPSHHEIVEINGDNWIAGRDEGVWMTDGQLGFTDMHGFESLGQLEKHMDICMHGFLGDAIIGGSYLDDPRWTLWEKYLHRGRRFILSALQHGEAGVRFRMPFLDLRLMDSLVQLPESQLRDSRAYRRILLAHWPEYFQVIPWQKTGLPLSLNPRTERFRMRLGRVGHRLSRLFTRDKNGEAAQYSDYANWMRREPAKAFIESILCPKEGSPLDAILPKSERRKVWDMHLSDRDQTELVSRYLTAAIWLQQVAERTPKPATDAIPVREPIH